MKQNDLLSKLQLLLAPIVLILLGLVLLVNPDSASALIARLLGWLLAAIGACCGFAAVFNAAGRFGKVAAAIIFAVVGGWLANNPLALAAWIGRIIGIVLLVGGISDFANARRRGESPGLSAVSAILGLILILLPMTASRLLFSLCGLAVLAVGVVMLLTRLKSRRFLDEPEDPNIIDAL